MKLPSQGPGQGKATWQRRHVFTSFARMSKSTPATQDEGRKRCAIADELADTASWEEIGAHRARAEREAHQRQAQPSMSGEAQDVNAQRFHSLGSDALSQV
jgi:hypothetical protein